ncbi:4Fe-4S cluster-binding domain-containing protein [Micromonospora sp. DT44]|uniref:4Fe-4S single cluster domain-containing protein n=1 Tax=Micromonospora sp. DT44 TaxID=3393439 RepID=UPI003CFA2193
MTTIEISRLHHPVTTLGYGRRAGIWLQGCTLACAGCLARDTWPRRPDRSVPVEEVLDWLRSLPQGIDGVTISGGEPLQQPVALAALLRGLTTWRHTRPIDILLYTGYGWSRAARLPELRASCDAVVAGRYVERRNNGDTPLRGSANQRLITLSPLGQQRYGETAQPVRAGLQTGVLDGRLWLVGIPRPGELDQIADHLRARGIGVGESTWSG